jgi:hypothetical protein
VDGFTAPGYKINHEHLTYGPIKVKEKPNINQFLVKLKTSSNPIAKKLRSRTYKPKVIQSKKLYNRKKEKHGYQTED